MIVDRMYNRFFIISIADYVALKEGNVAGPWAQRAYVAPVIHLENLGVSNHMNHVPGHVDFRVGSEKKFYVTEQALKKKGIPGPTDFVP